MPHPVLGLPPSDAAAGRPAAGARLRADRARLADLAIQATLRLDATFAQRYDELELRRLLRDFNRHVEQLARALETGEARYVTEYGESIVPVYRRRAIRMNDYVTLIHGLREAAQSTLAPADQGALRGLIDAWVARARHHARLAGDHQGNKLARFIWKGAGLGDDTVV